MPEEFAKTFRENCKFLGITSGPITPEEAGDGTAKATVPETVTLSEGAPGTKLTAFVILPFVERHPKHPNGFFRKFYAV
jgi:hypothetical protein